MSDDNYVVSTHLVISRGVAPTLIKYLGDGIISKDGDRKPYNSISKSGFSIVKAYVLWHDGLMTETDIPDELKSIDVALETI